MVAGRYPNAKFILCSTFSHLIPPQSEAIPSHGSSQNNVQAITVNQCSFPAPPTEMTKISPTKNPHGDISQQRGGAVPNTPRRFATPTVFGLQG